MKLAIFFASLISAAVLAAQTAAEGLAAVEAGRLDEGVRILSEVVGRDPKSVDGHFYLGLAYFRAAGSPAGVAAYQRAAAAFRKACELSPRHEEACYYLARNLYVLGEYEQALAPFEKALAAVPPPMRAKVHRAMALNLAALDSPAEAEPHFLKAIQLAGQAPSAAEDARVDYGAFLFRQGRTAEALGPLQKAADYAPQSARANLEFGRVLLYTGKAAEAAGLLETAVRLAPENSHTHLLLGRAYLMLGKAAEGEREMKTGAEVLSGSKRTQKQ